MQNEEVASDAAKSDTPLATVDLNSVAHQFIEVGKELLSKPNALCDVLEADGIPATIVYCNSPSDADFIDVMLRKRGIASQKLIGFVPKPKLDKALADFERGALSVLVVTDIGARGIDLSSIEIVVHYSAPTDKDLYVQRTGQSEDPSLCKPGKLKKILTLLSPLDAGNWHYVRKSYDYGFEQIEPPPAEVVHGGKIVSLKRQAASEPIDDKSRELAEVVLKDPACKDIVALLVYNTLEVMPPLRVAANRDELRDEDFVDDGDDDDRQPRWNDRGGDRERSGNRGGGDRGGRGGYDRDDRGGRDNRRRSRDRNDDRGGFDDRGRDDRGGRDERGRDDRGRDERGRDDRGNGRHSRDRDNQRGERERREPLPQVREARIYVSCGAENGMSSDALTKLVSDTAGVESGAVKRASIRPRYAFFDVAEELSDDLIAKLGDTKFDGKTVKASKAITLSQTRAELEKNLQQNDERPERSESSEADDEGQGPSYLDLDDDQDAGSTDDLN